MKLTLTAVMGKLIVTIAGHMDINFGHNTGNSVHKIQ